MIKFLLIVVWLAGVFVAAVALTLQNIESGQVERMSMSLKVSVRVKAVIANKNVDDRSHHDTIQFLVNGIVSNNSNYYLKMYVEKEDEDSFIGTINPSRDWEKPSNHLLSSSKLIEALRKKEDLNIIFMIVPLRPNIYPMPRIMIGSVELKLLDE